MFLHIVAVKKSIAEEFKASLRKAEELTCLSVSSQVLLYPFLYFQLYKKPDFYVPITQEAIMLDFLQKKQHYCCRW